MRRCAMELVACNCENAERMLLMMMMLFCCFWICCCCCCYMFRHHFLCHALFHKSCSIWFMIFRPVDLQIALFMKGGV